MLTWVLSAWQKLDGESLQNAGLSSGFGDLVHMVVTQLQKIMIEEGDGGIQKAVCVIKRFDVIGLTTGSWI